MAVRPGRGGGWLGRQGPGPSPGPSLGGGGAGRRQGLPRAEVGCYLAGAAAPRVGFLPRRQVSCGCPGGAALSGGSWKGRGDRPGPAVGGEERFRKEPALRNARYGEYMV